jgi:hypothetical protein
MPAAPHQRIERLIRGPRAENIPKRVNRRTGRNCPKYQANFKRFLLTIFGYFRILSVNLRQALYQQGSYPNEVLKLL